MARQVFTGQEVPHIFASRSQDSGRNSNGTLYFRGDTLFSYRDSFPIAHFFGDAVLFNADSYSVTTSKHMGWARRALRQFESFEIPNLTGFLECVRDYNRLPSHPKGEYREYRAKQYEKSALEYIERQLKIADGLESELPRMRSEWKISEKRSRIRMHQNAAAMMWHSVMKKRALFNTVRGKIEKADKAERRERYTRAFNDLSARIEMRRTNPVPDAYEGTPDRRYLWQLENLVSDIMRADSLGARRGRSGVLQTATFTDAEKIMGKKWADSYFALAAQLDDIAAPVHARIAELRPELERQEREENAERLESWLSGQSAHAPRLSRIYCRVVGDEVQTSAGARVPLSDALRVVEIAKRCRATGEAFARDTFATGVHKGIRVDGQGNVNIGCHALPWDSIAECVARFAPEIELGE